MNSNFVFVEQVSPCAGRNHDCSGLLPGELALRFCVFLNQNYVSASWLFLFEHVRASLAAFRTFELNRCCFVYSA